MAKGYLKWALIGATAAVTCLPYPAVSGTLPPPPFIPPNVGSELPVFAPEVPGIELSDEATDEITRRFREARQFCGNLPSAEYTVDCLGDALGQIARSLPATGDYAEAHAAILQASEKLRALARANADPTLPRGTVRQRGPNARSSSSPLTPVRSDALADVNRQAVAILEEAETILLRSAENSAARKVHYQQIAAAVGSNKVLLRST
jgi:hypothetical protein